MKGDLPGRPGPRTVGVLLGLAGLLAGGAPEYAAGDLPPATPDLHQVIKEIRVRGADGTPVAGLTVALVGAPVDVGGPPPDQQPAAPLGGVTDGQGRVAFLGLGSWIWIVSFAGTYQGRPLVAVAEQGRPPYGPLQEGGGLPVHVEVQEEGAASPPLVVGGLVPAATQPTGVVLLPGGAGWIPTWDLALPAERPLPWTAARPASGLAGEASPPPPVAPATSGAAPAMSSRANKSFITTSLPGAAS